VALFTAYRAVLSVQKYALANVDLQITLGRVRAFAGSVAKGTLRIGYLDGALAGAYGALFGLHHIHATPHILIFN
jgi:hypothetical protein